MRAWQAQDAKARFSELLDATLELQSSAEQGTTFHVTFPARYAAR